MAKIQKNYRIEEDLIRKMRRLADSYAGSTVNYTVILETALTKFLDQATDQIHEQLREYLLDKGGFKVDAS